MSADEFFVGYLPTPPRQRRFLLATVLALLVVVIVVALALAGLQHDPGEGTWDTDHVVELDGVIRAAPYPVLETRDSAVLLVSEGKVSADSRVRQYDGRSAALKGYLLNRKGMSMLELQTAPDFLHINAQNLSPQPPATASNPMTVHVRGEIVDSKCFLGAMKPGDGKTHKACAALCIRGGLPPMLVSFDSSGKRTDYLLVDDSGGALTGAALEAVIPFVADSVEVTGDAQQRGLLTFLRIQPVGAIRRL